MENQTDKEKQEEIQKKKLSILKWAIEEVEREEREEEERKKKEMEAQQKDKLLL